MSILDQFAGQLGRADSIPASGSAAVARRVNADLERWQGRVETDGDVYPWLAEYWQTAGLAEWTPAGTPWSAAWVSHMQGAGFPPAAAHWRYIEAVMQGRAPGWQAYSIPANPGLPLAPGDVLIKPRSGDYYSTHGDIVVSVEDGQAVTVGGNLSNTVRVSERIPVDASGAMLDHVRGAGGYVIALKKKKGPLWPWIAALGLAGVLVWRRQ